MDGATLTKRGISVLRRLAGGAPADVALVALAALVQIGGTVLAARHQTDARTLDVLVGYPCFQWAVNLVNGKPPPSPWMAVGIAAWMLLLVAVSELVTRLRERPAIASMTCSGTAFR